LVAILIVCGVLLAGVPALWWQYKHYEYAYAALAPNTSRAEVLKQFGRPREVRQCSQSKLSWDAESLQIEATKCVEEYWYFSRISPEQWVIGFDEGGRVITKYHLVSP